MYQKPGQNLLSQNGTIYFMNKRQQKHEMLLTFLLNAAKKKTIRKRPAPIKRLYHLSKQLF